MTNICLAKCLILSAVKIRGFYAMWPGECVEQWDTEIFSSFAQNSNLVS